MDIWKSGFALREQEEKKLRPIKELINSSSLLQIKGEIEKELLYLAVYAEQATLKKEKVLFEMVGEVVDEVVYENVWLRLSPLKAITLILNKKIDSRNAFQTSSPFSEHYYPGDIFLTWEVPFNKIGLEGIHYLQSDHKSSLKSGRVVEYEWHGNSLDLFCPNNPQRRISITPPRLNILAKLIPEFSESKEVVNSIPKNQVVSTINNKGQRHYKGISELFPKQKNDGFDYSSLYKRNTDGSISKGSFFNDIILKEKKSIE